MFFKSEIVFTYESVEMVKEDRIERTLLGMSASVDFLVSFLSLLAI